MIQVHYHNGLGGVSRVINQYDQAFRRNSADGKSILFCAQRTPEHSITIYDAQCDYGHYPDVPSFENARRRLRMQMKALIDSVATHSVILICHNLSLGKNVALSAAMADIARIYYKHDNIACFWLVHDLIEEGRMHLLARVNELEKLGIDVWSYLYPRHGMVYVCLNKRDQQLFATCGIESTLLPNYIPPRKQVAPGVIRRFYDYLQREVPMSGSAAKRPIFFYPVRLISRKNVIEAIILAVVKHAGILILGGKGHAPEDVCFSEKLRNFCHGCGLDVIFDIESRAENAGFDRQDIFPACYMCSDWCLTTSVAEGFGFGLYEPWVYGTALVGRAPEGFESSGGVMLSHLYRSFDIPAEWVSEEKLQKSYRRHLQALINVHGSGSQGAFTELIHSLLEGGKIDFGLLDHQQQFSILSRLVSQELDLEALASPLYSQIESFSADESLIVRNSNRIDEAFTKQFDRRFKQCYMSDSRLVREISADLSGLRRHFIRPQTSRLLLVAHC